MNDYMKLLFVYNRGYTPPPPKTGPATPERALALTLIGSCQVMMYDSV